MKKLGVQMMSVRVLFPFYFSLACKQALTCQSVRLYHSLIFLLDFFSLSILCFYHFSWTKQLPGPVKTSVSCAMHRKESNKHDWCKLHNETSVSK